MPRELVCLGGLYAEGACVLRGLVSVGRLNCIHGLPFLARNPGAKGPQEAKALRRLRARRVRPPSVFAGPAPPAGPAPCMWSDHNFCAVAGLRRQQ